MGSIRFYFDREMDQASFSIAEHVVRFTGPAGPLAATGYLRADPSTLEVTFESQSAAGTYEMVIGPGILDQAAALCRALAAGV